MFLGSKISILWGIDMLPTMRHFIDFIVSRGPPVESSWVGLAENLFKGSDSAGRYSVLFIPPSFFFLPAIWMQQ